MSYTYSHLEDFIRKVYHDIDVYSPAQLNLYMIADALNIGLYPINDISQALRSDGRDYIFLNNSLKGSERFEVFGHELGHLLTHAGNQVAMSQDFIEYQEKQADLFALHFCIPTFMLQEIWLPKDFKQAVQNVSKTFNVTPLFASKRLELYKQKVSQTTTYKKSLQSSEMGI